MALTFGTLLSSQGAEAHRPDPFGPIRGNLVYVTRSVSHGQHGPAPPGGVPLGRGDWPAVGIPRPRADPPGPTRASLYGEVRRCGSGSRRRATLVKRSAATQIPRRLLSPPSFPGPRCGMRRGPPRFVIRWLIW